MLPKIHLGTLITVTDSHLANQSRERKQAIMEARANRNLEGFYVYQTYLKRLRRMHRAYVARVKQQKSTSLPSSSTNQSQDLFGNYITTHQFQYDTVGSNDRSQLPWLKHRLSLSGPPPTPNETVDTCEAPLKSTSFLSHVSSDAEEVKGFAGVRSTAFKDNASTRPSCSIHIPCGREDSFELSCSFQNESKLAKSGDALPFRMWKQRHVQSGLPTVYTQDSIAEEIASKPRIVSSKSIPRTTIEGKCLFMRNKK